MKKTAVITGGHHSLGLAISEEFAAHNYNLIITYHNNKELALKTQDTLQKKYAIEVDLYAVDFNNQNSTYQFINSIKQKYQKIDVIVNNAAYTKEEEFEKKDIQEINKILNINTVAPFIIINGLYKIMPENSSIINIVSTNGIDTYSPLTMEYDASKAALISLTKNFAIALAPKIRVNAIAPGWIKTNVTNSMNPNYIEKEISKICLKRFAEPSEIASVVYFLVTPEAKYINGEVIRVDGGQNVTR